MWGVGLEEVELYVLMSHNMIAHYIAMQLHMDLYEEAVQRPGEWVSKGSGNRRV